MPPPCRSASCMRKAFLKQAESGSTPADPGAVLIPTCCIHSRGGLLRSIATTLLTATAHLRLHPWLTFQPQPTACPPVSNRHGEASEGWAVVIRFLLRPTQIVELRVQEFTLPHIKQAAAAQYTIPRPVRYQETGEARASSTLRTTTPFTM